MNAKEKYPWRLFWVLFTAGLIGLAAAMPYTVALIGGILRRVALPVPLPLLLGLQFLQGAVVLAIAVGLGLLLSRKIGLGAPALEAWLYQRAAVKPRTFQISIISGAAIATLIVLLVYFVFLRLMPQLPVAMEAAIPLWKRFLACFYGGLYEELLMRFFILSLFLWLISKVWRRPDGRPTRTAFWTANIIVAVLFGLGHMPLASQLMPVTAVTIVYILSLNGIAALAFGYLYWERGLEAAMVAHFTADLVLHVASPALLK
ncbi:MAG TPA: CPBP family intramembrane glutamic endopeptidase [Chthoniobacterales bacterium]|jgi:membrane protease YdiL (CAAX protease family)